MRKIIIIGIAILLCASFASAAIGFIAGQEYATYRFSRKWRGEGRIRERIMAKLDRRLNLDPAQKERISAILESKTEQFKTAKKRFGDSAKSIRESTERQIKECLRPDQIEKFDRMMDKMKSGKKRMHKKCLYGKEAA